MTMTLPVLAYLFSAAATLMLCLFAQPISAALGILDIPDARKQHHAATPLMGGVVLLFAFAPVIALFVVFAMPRGLTHSLLVWLASVVAMALVGMADDRHSLSARNRLLISFFVFGMAAAFDPLFNVRVLSFELGGFELGLGTVSVAVAFTILCCVGLVNAINMADGKNGLVIGLCLGWTGLLATRAPNALVPVLAVLFAVLAVLLLFNLRGRLFLGDGGAYGLASAIGLLAILVYNTRGSHAGRAIAADELVLLFLVPVIDSFRLTFVRLLRGQSPMSADRDHLHHHLQARFGWLKGLCVYLLLALLPPALWFMGGA
jgi:UDP-GlcNAc:undecaprenyl-phosphate/decaprenyl-phosphate GlcNAc-1-phosphate transferase